MAHDGKSSDNQTKKDKSEKEGISNNAFNREPCVWDKVDRLGSKGIGLMIFGIILLFLLLSLFI